MSKSLYNKDPDHIARARRAKSLRNMTGLSRRDFAKEAGIAPSTQQNWESEAGNGLTERGAKRLLKIYDRLGIHVSFEWLMHGLGPSPIIDNRLYQKSSRGHYSRPPKSNETQITLIQEELALFRQHYKEAIDLIVPDDSMTPRFIAGEWVAGNRYYNNDIEVVIDQDCIVLTDDGKILLRHLRKGNTPGYYTLVCSNHMTAAADPTLYDVKLISAAPVIWTRRKEKERVIENCEKTTLKNAEKDPTVLN